MENRSYWKKKILEVILTLLVVTLLSFLLMRLSPIDPATAYVTRNTPIVTAEQIQEARVKLGLDQPLLVQYGQWVFKACQLDFGISLASGRSVTTEIGKALPVSLAVVLLSGLIMGLGSIMVGSLHYFLWDHWLGLVLSLVAILGLSIPAFYLASRLQALKNGEVDMLYGNVLMTYDEYQQAIQMASIGGEISDHNSETRNLALNAGSVMLNDLKVREALAYAIDKEAISKGLTYGYEEVAETLFDEGIPYTDVKLNAVRRFDLEKANALLDEAGWVKNASTGIREKDGVSLKLTFTYDSGEIMNKSIATLLKSQLSEVGIEVETVGQDMYTWWKEGIAGNYDITIWCTEQPYNSPHNFFTPMLDSSCHVPAIAALADGQTFTNAIKAFSTTDDPAQVTEIFSYLLNYSNDNVLNIPLTYVKDMIVYNTDKIEDYTFTTTPMFFEVDGITPAV